MAQRIYVVTGANRGIGLGLVRELISRGHKVIATCRDPSNATDLKSLLTQHEQPEPVACDVADDPSIEKCYTKVAELVSHVDVLINNAGMSNKNHPDEPPSTINRQEFLSIMNTNVAGVMAMTKAFLPLLRKSSSVQDSNSVGANVINISSLIGSVELTAQNFTCPSYRCSKAAVNMLTKCFSNEITDLVFVAIHPGWVQTDMGCSKNRSPPVSVPDSAKAVLDVSLKITRQDSGSFWSFEGHKLPY